jgi:hypothetical protein
MNSHFDMNQAEEFDRRPRPQKTWWTGSYSRLDRGSKQAIWVFSLFGAAVAFFTYLLFYLS